MRACTSISGSLPPASPRKVVYCINRHTARLLKLDLQESVLQGAEVVID